MQVRGVALANGTGVLLYHFATKTKPQISEHLSFIVKYIVMNKLDTNLRIDKAIEYALSHINKIDVAEFERYCGVGVVVSPEEIEKIVEKHLNANKNDLLEKRYRFNVGLVMQKVRNELPWADGKSVKNEVDVQVNIAITVSKLFVGVFFIGFRSSWAKNRR